jgi:small GTP-binding protein
LLSSVSKLQLLNHFSLVRLTVADKPITFQLFDTAGQEQFNVIRRLAYPQTNIFLLCFNLVDQISFQNVKEKWVPELREFAPKVPIILVGLQSDERNVHPMKWSQGSQKSKPIKTEEGELLARKIGAKKYMECSACTQKNVKNVFDTAVMTVLEQQERKERSHGNSLRASFRRLSKRRGLSRSTSDTSSCSRSSTGTYRTTKASERSSTSSSSLFNISITESLRDIFCFG